jgi:hypothetical protein
MPLTMNCNILGTGFLTAIACAILGNVAGVIAWRNRKGEFSKWQWLIDPTYAFRARYYQQPNLASRRLAMGLLTLGGLVATVVAVAIMRELQTGSRSVCGFAF